jgi:hypothetical protein
MPTSLETSLEQLKAERKPLADLFNENPRAGSTGRCNTPLIIWFNNRLQRGGLSGLSFVFT